MNGSSSILPIFGRAFYFAILLSEKITIAHDFSDHSSQTIVPFLIAIAKQSISMYFIQYQQNWVLMEILTNIIASETLTMTTTAQ